jgi:urease accessory protein
MKLLTPVSRGPSVWAYTSNFGGGLVAGDETSLELALGSGTCCYVGSQSSTKIYRNPAGLDCSHTTQATVSAGARLVFAPEPVQAFAGSRYVQRQAFHLQIDAGLVLLDWFTSGRAARGERWNFAHLESRNEVFYRGERVLVDPVRLGSPAAPAQMGRFNCLASLLLLGVPFRPQAEALLQSVARLTVSRNAGLASSASPLRQGALLRITGEEVETVRRAIHAHLFFLRDMLGDDPWSRKW